SYFNEGATYWDLYTHKLAEERLPNALHYNRQLLQLNAGYLDDLLEPYRTINVVDIGPGNAMPVKQLLAHLIERDKMGRYIAIDISQDMLNIAKHNIESWYGDAIRYEGHVRDINYDRFNDLLMSESFGKEGVVNLILFLGDTISNFRDSDHSLTVIHDSMGKNDILVFTGKLDTEKSRRYFDFNVSTKDPKLGFRGKAMLDLLGIDSSFYTLEELFNEEKRARQRQIRLKVSLSLEFELAGERHMIELHKDEALLLWRARHRNAIEIINEFDRNNFETLQATQTKDQQYFEVIAKIKSAR
ncbi:L-histidine N(alpha)-methyltransferase, partial [Candidatus Saccharibacteria bacterium]|nr:L-histidine N(alpha)-methyltransferase [Candidatus Saccharibacteria bacterium]